MKHFFLSILVLVVTNACFAQQQYTFTNYTREQGLPFESIRGIYKDATGYIWITSEGGVPGLTITANAHRQSSINCRYISVQVQHMSFLRMMKNKFNCIHSGKIEVKNKRGIDMYFVKTVCLNHYFFNFRNYQNQ